MKKIALHWQILIGMGLGVLFGILAVWLGFIDLAADWIAPFGTIFINLLKLIAIPLIIASLIKGVSDMKNLSRLSVLGGRTVALYLATTVVAVTIGLVIVNVVQPGAPITEETRTQLVGGLSETDMQTLNSRRAAAQAQKDQSPIQPLVDLVPDNAFMASTSNANMLQVIFVVIFFWCRVDSRSSGNRQTGQRLF